jgi:hypothetical protein
MKIVFLVCIISFLCCMDLTAQWDNDIVCPGDSSQCEWIDTVSRKVQLSFKHDQYANVTYRYRICNGVLEIDVLTVTTIDNAGNLRTFSIEHYEFASLRSAVELGVMTDHEEQIGIPGLPAKDIDPNTIYTCTDTVSYVTFFTASCGIFVKCIYERTSASRVCDNGYDPPYPEIVQNGIPKVVYQKWQKCGYNCCKKQYKICRSMSSTGGVTGNSQASIPILKIIESKITSVTDCSLQTKYGSNPCYTNCWNAP